MLKRLIRGASAQAGLAWLIGSYLQIALRTTRWRFDGFEHVRPHLSSPPVIAAFWHEHLPLMPVLWLEARRLGAAASGVRMHVLVSQHRDGRLIGAIMGRFRVGTVYGSSSRGGPASLRSLKDLLGRGDLVAITPDGPQGPRRQAAPGVAQLAALSAVRVLPCAAQTTSRRVLSSWDRMVLPLPFGRGVVVCGPTIDVLRESWQQAVPLITAAIDRAAERACELCAG